MMKTIFNHGRHGKHGILPEVCGALTAIVLGLCIVAVGMVVFPDAQAQNPAVNVRPSASLPVHELPFERLYLSKVVSVTSTSQSFAELIGEALHEDVIRVQLINRDASVAVHVAASDTATVANARIGPGENLGLSDVFGGLSTAEFVAGSDSAVSVDLFAWRIRQAGE